ncbi:MAG: hypothetical protein ABIP48_33745 [Planctomycetota bacterium]
MSPNESITAMATKLNCPYCGETFPYDRSLAGRSGLCSHCENPIKVPLVEELPEELQEELRREEAKRQQKQKRTYHRKQERYLKEIEKEEKLKLKQEAREKQAELEKKVESAQEPVAEELAVKKRYRALRAVAGWNKAVAGLVLLGYVASIMMGVGTALRGVLPWSWLLSMALLLAVPATLTALTAWASGQLILVLLDMADDARITRLLMKKQAYRREDS